MHDLAGVGARERGPHRLLDARIVEHRQAEDRFVARLAIRVRQTSHQRQPDVLGIHACGKGCLYLSTLADVDVKVLARILTNSAKNVKRLFPVQ